MDRIFRGVSIFIWVFFVLGIVMSTILGRTHNDVKVSSGGFNMAEQSFSTWVVSQEDEIRTIFIRSDFIQEGLAIGQDWMKVSGFEIRFPQKIPDFINVYVLNEDLTLSAGEYPRQLYVEDDSSESYRKIMEYFFAADSAASLNSVSLQQVDAVKKAMPRVE